MSDFPNTQIPENLRELVNAQLMDDETIQWIDQPIPYYFSVVSAFVFGLGIIWTVTFGFLLCVVVLELVLEPPPVKPPPLGIPMTLGPPPVVTIPIIALLLLPGLFLLSVPLLMCREVKQTIYALTNLRAIIVQGTLSGFNVTNFYPADFVEMFCKQKADGTGNLCFRNGVWDFLEPTKRGFCNIRNVVKVERMLQELKRTKSPEQG